MTKHDPTSALDTYREAAARHPDAVVLIRFGDFYEVFGQHAGTVARLLGLTLTRAHADPMVPAVGVPAHLIDWCCEELRAAGHRPVTYHARRTERRVWKYHDEPERPFRWGDPRPARGGGA